MRDSTKGGLVVFFAYVMWGSMPFYWKALRVLAPMEILAHRIVWSFTFTLLLLAAAKQLCGLARKLRDERGTLGALVASGVLVTLNWYLYIWAVNNDRVLDTSLGYFINPLMSILLGVAIFREKLGAVQWTAIALAAAGVSVQVFEMGRLPLVSLGLALTFALYGAIRKKTDIDPVPGLFVETAVVTAPALLWLFHMQAAGTAHYPYGAALNLLLVGAGILSSMALILFAWGAKKVRLSTVGLIQYTSPIMTFLTAVFIYGESVSPLRLASFVLIWAGIIIYTAHSLLAARKLRQNTD